MNNWRAIEFAGVRGHTCAVITRQDWRFGPWLAERRREAGLSQNKLGRKIGHSGTLIRYLESGLKKGEPYRATYAVVKALSEVLNFDLKTGLALAGVPAEPVGVDPAGDLRDWSVYELLSDLAQRYREAQQRREAEGPRLPDTDLTGDQIEARGEWCARLEALAIEARNAGDTVAADAMGGLARDLNAQIEAIEAAQPINGPHQDR